MITEELYKKIEEKYGSVASWAYWDKADLKPKSNIGNMHLFNIKQNPLLLQTLKTNVVMIGLNFSRPVTFTESFKNFHDSNPHAQDFKIRFAFQDTVFYGAYMTDLIKNMPMKSSHELKTLLGKNQKIINENLITFLSELHDIEAKDPIILAFGTDVYDLLNRNLDKSEYSILIKLTHYSHQIGKEEYKTLVFKQIEEKYSGNIIDSKKIIS